MEYPTAKLSGDSFTFPTHELVNNNLWKNGRVQDLFDSMKNSNAYLQTALSDKGRVFVLFVPEQLKRYADGNHV